MNITRYLEAQKAEKLRKFYAMSFIQHWLMSEAERHNNLYTRCRAASQLVLFAGRLILAHNRVFFPYHKWFYEYLSRCPEKPAALIEMMDRLLKESCIQHATALFQSVKDFQEWGVSDIDAFIWFMEDIEWSWMNSKASLEDW